MGKNIYMTRFGGPKPKQQRYADAKRAQREAEAAAKAEQQRRWETPGDATGALVVVHGGGASSQEKSAAGSSGGSDDRIPQAVMGEDTSPKRKRGLAASLGLNI